MVFNQESTNITTTTAITPLDYQIYPQAIYTSRLFNFTNLPKPKNEENFERKLEELAKYVSILSVECNQKCNGYWCKLCNSKHFQNDFNNWTSGNDKIDKFIRDAQLNANYYWEAIEWIPYDRFKDVKQIDGLMDLLENENQQWERYQDGDEVGIEVALKKFDNFVNFNDILNEVAIHFKTHVEYASIRFYGITQDPETHSYMMVLDYAKDGNLREYLKINFNNINWEHKLQYLYLLSLRLINIHKLDIVHQDFHPGNILSSNFEDIMWISDFGLSKLIGTNPNNPEKKNIVGVLPYIAPEVLSGEKEYKKAADVYSFGIIAYEIITGIPPYPDIPHDEDLAMKICYGLRPKIPFHTPKLITRTIMRCWDARVTHRPTFKESSDELEKYYRVYIDYLLKEKDKDSEIVIQIKKAEEFSENQESINKTTTLNYQTHPQAIYTSRLLNFSKFPKPKNEENFERELEELTESFTHIITGNRLLNFSKFPKPKNEENFERELEELTESFTHIITDDDIDEF
ncbi:hypothetical protein Glove_276g22 [Diversispora epigaea]|uniref:non-specific serine/threonine protein kinase n=1 Tax=Diversispora epigaea TaxID=1348612 RepID=A0A397I2V9_9GLOM|nr:hypothetical protein Glove_276g22 [Diversispora epigaea]